MRQTRAHRQRFGAGVGLVALFAVGCCVALALGSGVGSSLGYLAVTTKVKPTRAALSVAKTTCAQLRQRVGAKSFARTFKTPIGCRNILAPSAQTAIKTCKQRRYPAGSTAYTFCLQLVLEGTPAHKAALAGLRIITDRTVTFIPVPGSGQGAGTGGGTGAGTGGGPAHH